MEKLSLKIKLLLAFGILSAVVLLVGMLGYRSVGKLSNAIEYVGKNELPGVEAVLKMEYQLSVLSRHTRVLTDPSADRSERFEALAGIKQAQKYYGALKDGYEALEMTPEERQVFSRFRERSEGWFDAKAKLIALHEEFLRGGILNPDALSREIEAFRGDYYKGIREVIAFISFGQAMETSSEISDSRFGQWMAAYDGENREMSEILRRASSVHASYYESLVRVVEYSKNGNLEAARSELETSLLARADEMAAIFYSIIDVSAKADALLAEMSRIETEEALPLEQENMSYLDQIVSLRVQDANHAVNESVLAGHSARTMALVFTLLAVVGAMGYGLVFGGRLSRQLDEISSMVNLSASETRVAAEQVSEASSSLAEGASEQAASLEETSSAMEEMTSMVSRDAELASSTAEQALEAHRAVKAGVQSIAVLRGGVDAAGSSAKDLSLAMDGIKTSSDSISKIIRTIDEIAFQTNILALNASVEAARAGEAGAGFAVVADEVRSLAHRAADAARETQVLVEDSIGRSDEGVRMNQHVNERLDEVLKLAGVVESELDVIVSSVTVVDQSMGELKASLDEQQSGITQINTGVTQISDVTQLNAASAEESASASEELNAQAHALVDVVDGLSALVNGKVTKKAPLGALMGPSSGGQPLLGAAT